MLIVIASILTVALLLTALISFKLINTIEAAAADRGISPNAVYKAITSNSFEIRVNRAYDLENANN